MEGKVKVLLIEDDDKIIDLIKSSLDKEKFDLIGEFKEAEKALEKLTNLDPDILLVDIALKGEMNGVSFIKLAKEIKDFAFIYITATSDQEILEEAKATLPDSFLGKPFQAHQLGLMLDFSLNKHLEDKKVHEKLKKKYNRATQQLQEMSDTNSHLVTATLRERDLKFKLQESSRIIEEQNKKILDSINYAKRIQKAIIPTDEELKEALGDYFMYYKPKDVVSGDFPWLIRKDGMTYIAAVDCTGHGVPGAMMSLIGYLLLNGIMEARETPTPSEVLNELHKDVVKTLRQDDPENKAADGMDVAICRIDKKNKEVLYSGAHRPLYILKDGEVDQIKGDKFPIGGMQYKGENEFTDASVKFKGGESIYFFSDGLPDQFGGPDKLKFGPKRIRKLIEENNAKPLEEQKEVLSKAFEEWMGEDKQIDDVLMLGIKF